MWNENARIYTISAITSLGGYFFGADTGLIGGVIAMNSFKRSFGLDKLSVEEFASVSGNIVSILQLGCFAGCIFISIIANRFGRKLSMILTCAVFTFGSLLQVVAGVNGSKALGILYVGRFIGGMGVGAISMLVPVYLSENAPRRIRGRCVGMMQLAIVTGIAVANWVNFAVVRTIHGDSQKQWRIPFGVQIIPSGLLMIAMFFMNESPRWLAEHRGEEEARRSMAWVRGLKVDDVEIVEEVKEIVRGLEEEENLVSKAERGRFWVLREIWSSKSLRKRTMIGVAIQIGQQFTGQVAINYYSPLFFQEVGIVGTESDLLATGVYGIVKIVVCVAVLMFSLEQLGRRRSLIYGGVGMGLSMIIAGIIVRVNPPQMTHSSTVPSGKPPIHPASYIAIVCIYLFVSFYNFSWGPVTFILTGELFPNHIRAICASACLALQWLANYTITKTTPLMISSWGYGTFLFFGVFCIVDAGFAWVVIPETKGVGLEDMGTLFGDTPAAQAVSHLPELRDGSANDFVIVDSKGTEK